MAQVEDVGAVGECVKDARNGAAERLASGNQRQRVEIALDGNPRLHLMCVCEDVLVRQDGELRVRERRVSRDDRP